MQVTALNTSAGRRKFFTLPGLSVLAEIVLILKFYSAAEVQKYLSSGDMAVTSQNSFLSGLIENIQVNNKFA